MKKGKKRYRKTRRKRTKKIIYSFFTTFLCLYFIQSNQNYKSKIKKKKIQNNWNHQLNDKILCTKIFYRKLLTISMWNPVRAFYGILSNPNLYPIWIDCNYIVGILLVKQKCNTSSCCPWRHHCVDYDNTYVIDKCSITKNLVR